MQRILFLLYSGLTYLVFLATFVWSVAFGADFVPAALRAFGAIYQDYRRRVPMLIPFPRRNT
jgi:protein-S-isoprenylcysteine O-methyltransferase Ste14